MLRAPAVLLLLLAASCGPATPLGQPCRSSVFLLERQPCPSGYTCRFTSACDSDVCEGTCVVSCATAPCGGACFCSVTPETDGRTCFPPPDAGPSCERSP